MAAILRDSVVVVRTRPRAIPLATMTTRNSIHGFPLLSHTRMMPNFGGPSDQAELRDKLSGQASLRVGCLLQALEQCGRSNKGAGEEQGLGEKRGLFSPGRIPLVALPLFRCSSLTKILERAIEHRARSSRGNSKEERKREEEYPLNSSLSPFILSFPTQACYWREKYNKNYKLDGIRRIRLPTPSLMIQLTLIVESTNHKTNQSQGPKSNIVIGSFCLLLLHCVCFRFRSEERKRCSASDSVALIFTRLYRTTTWTTTSL